MNDIKQSSFVPRAALFLGLAGTITVAACGKGQGGTGCDGVTAQFAAVRAGGTQACAVDTDCACFNGLDRDVPCGGVIDAKTATRLKELEKDFTAKSCKLPHQCAAQMCMPRCVAAQCVSKP